MFPLNMFPLVSSQAMQLVGHQPSSVLGGLRDSIADDSREPAASSNEKVHTSVQGWFRAEIPK